MFVFSQIVEVASFDAAIPGIFFVVFVYECLLKRTPYARTTGHVDAMKLYELLNP